ncbi:MAG: response regulator transcription factor [Armatimonadetes bacterium]|nr:response regulator transcription factor [Armatimonadota bacterium]
MENEPAIAVVIVAVYPSDRVGLHTLLQPGVLVLDEASSGAELGAILADLRPDTVVLDTTGEEGTAVSQTLGGIASAGRAGEVGLLVLGDAPTTDLPVLAGADGLPGWGYLLRGDVDAAQAASALRSVAQGLVVLDRSLAVYMARPAPVKASEPNKIPAPVLPGETLTPREIEVLQQMAEGLANKQIGTKLGISLHTVKFHVAQILGKLNAVSRTEAVTTGARRGYVLL